MNSPRSATLERLPASAGALWGVALAAGVFGVVALLDSRNAEALQWGAEATVGVLDSDNIFRTESAEKNALIRVGEFDFSAAQTTGRLDLDAVGSVLYRQYGISGVSDDTLPTFTGVARWAVIPDRFSWVLSDNLGQFALNPNDSLLENDRETLNIVNTGPNLVLPVGAGSNISLGARYSHITYQRSPFDNNRYAGDLAFEHELESGSSWNIRFLDARTDYTDVNTQFDVRTASAGYTALGRRGEIDANVGYTMLSQFGENHSGFFADIRLERQMSRGLSVAVDFVDRYADSSEIFSRQQDLEPVIQSTVSFVPSDLAARELAADLSVALTGRRSDATVGAVYYQNDFVASGGADNRTGVGGYLDGNFRLSPTFALTSRAEIRREAPDIGSSATYSQVSAGVVWSFTRKLGLVLGVARFQQSGAADNYTEMRYTAALRWTIRKIPSALGSLQSTAPATRRIAISR